MQEVLHSSEGWPGLIHAVGRARALEMAKARVTQAASRAQGFTRRLTDARTELREGVTDFREAVERAETVQPGACPWRGLAAYDVGDARWQIGRERLIAELISLVAVGRFVAVVGSSGSGKSSLLRAGLLASVVAGALPGSANWATTAIRPGQHPMRELRHAVSHGEGAEGDRVADLVERMIPDWRTHVPSAACR